MAQGTQLTEKERGMILALKGEGLSNSAISKRINRSRKVVLVLLRDPEGYGSKKRTGRPRKLAPSAHRHLLREASKGDSTALTLRKTLNLSVSTRTVQRMLHNAENLVYKKMASAPMLTEKHKKARVEWAAEKVTWKDEWTKVVFSDEKNSI